MSNTVLIILGVVAIAQFGLIVLYVLSANDQPTRDKIVAIEKRLIDIESKLVVSNDNTDTPPKA